MSKYEIPTTIKSASLLPVPKSVINLDYESSSNGSAYFVAKNNIKWLSYPF